MARRISRALRLSPLLVLLILPYAAHAAGAFDGSWSVRVVVDQGDCVRPPGYRYFVKIEDGIVKPSDSGTLIIGRVTQTGTVKVRVSRGQDRASGTGRLANNEGSGNWKSATRSCSGRWTATRQ